MQKTNPVLLLVEDDDAVCYGYQRSQALSGYSILTAQTLADAKRIVLTENFDAMVLDLSLPDGNALEWITELKKMLPDLPVIVVTGSNDVPTAVIAMRSGADNFLIKPVEADSLELSLRTAVELGNLRRQNRIKQRLDKRDEPFFGASSAITTSLRTLKVAAATSTVLLIQGETGTGKGVLARWIHANSERAAEPFVELNCSCLKGDLLRSELFGHSKGSFTSAVAHREGLIEVADKGTLFLDEIGDMDLAVQAQLLKTIEERSFRRVGENRVRTSGFRLICATNKDLLADTDTGVFRKDLYYRICVFPIVVPPLRERVEDIEGLAEYLLREFGHPQVTLPDDVRQLLKEYPWPGNIRELRNMLERALLLAHDKPLSLECFPGLVPAATAPSSAKSYVFEPEKPANLRTVEQDHLRKVLESCNGNKNEASRRLGISLATIYRKLSPITTS